MRVDKIIFFFSFFSLYSILRLHIFRHYIISVLADFYANTATGVRAIFIFFTKLIENKNVHIYN